MKIIVCVKFIKGELNPFDSAALEAAFELVEKADLEGRNGEITILGMGPSAWLEPMKRLTRLGKNGNLRAVLLLDPLFAGSDTLATSRILAQAVKKIMQAGPVDWVFCGRQTVDGDTAQVGPELSTWLGFELVTNVTRLPEFQQNTAKIFTRNGWETVQSPAVLTLERICELRFPSLRSQPGIVEVWNHETIGISPLHCGTAGSPTRVLKTFTTEHGRRKCRWISFDELFPLVESLRQKPKAGIQISESSSRFPRIYAIGREVEAQARAIAEEVVFLEKGSAREIAEAVKEAEVVLWNADLWGRGTAPQTAALLETGLCADCTALETDGKTLFMYRPARSGDVVAKIECRTKPQMATVRTTGACSDVIVSGGRGVVKYWNQVCKLAEKLGAELVASRALVDSGVVPYELQVGLTGRNVSPKIYIAIGISGAIQHTCAIETSDVIIAINPDREARIFEYADYGILYGMNND